MSTTVKAPVNRRESLPPLLALVRVLSVAVSAALVFPSGAAGQRVSVQQPVVESLSAGASVSVPDRGRTVIGGVGRGATSRSTYGPLRMNSNFGSSFSGGSTSAHAWIHDFDELDRQALQSGDGPGPRLSVKRFDERAEHAYKTLIQRNRRADRNDSMPNRIAARRLLDQRGAPTGPNQSAATLSADELYRRGMKAQAAGQRGVALSFLRLARDRGSPAAQGELDKITRSSRTDPESRGSHDAQGDGKP